VSTDQVSDLEIEVKFYVRDLAAVEARLRKSAALLVQPRTHEINLRFDTPTGDLARSYRVLRLRQDTAARMTYKGPSQIQEGVRIRQEIEFTVGDFRSARKFLEAIGYQVSMIYEKYRTVYDLDRVHVALDELPYGDFVEIEGPDAASIHSVNQVTGLNWEVSVPESYTMLFERLRSEFNLPYRNLVFECFQGTGINVSKLNIKPAD
jgi:adenylate cyclase class 2